MAASDPDPTSPAHEQPLRLLVEFFRLESAGGLLLIAAAAFALILANSPLAHAYQGLLDLPVRLGMGDYAITKPLLLWINDGLMAIFFLLVALEIKREMLSGQLSDRAQLVLPLACACGGAVVPALVYVAFNRGDAAALDGWAIPAATDIAFPLGILSLLGSRAPLGLRLLLSTIAVLDDLIAIVVIAMFYTQGLSVLALLLAGLALIAMIALNRAGVVALTPYLLLGAALWVCVLKSGVHATLAGVATGLLIPLRDRRDPERSPLQRLEHALHPWVAFAILPVFAFANAGLGLAGFGMRNLLAPVPLGIVLGLLLGKPVGVIGAALIARVLGVGQLPENTDFKAIIGMAMLCGIGFTMSLFIGSLAFEHDGAAHIDASRLGILCGSTLAAVLGYLWLHRYLPRAPAP